jgi:CDP-diacylglycerol---glycerol-3-phosphate 3-phosphatidyltransferase
MISRWIRTWYSALLGPFLHFIARLGITADMLTVVSLFVVTTAGILFAFHQTIWGAWILLFGGFLDGVDGELARITGIKSPFGGFLDSICDHCGDFAIYIGLLFLYLQNSATAEIILIFVALFASVFGSHVRSRAGMLGIDIKTIGVFTRCERIFILVIGILISQASIALWGLAIFNSFSALQRVIYTIRVSHNNKVMPVYKTL